VVGGGLASHISVRMLESAEHVPVMGAVPFRI